MKVSNVVGTSAGMIQKWRDMFITFTDHLEPKGSLLSRNRVRVAPGASTQCPFCGQIGSAQRADGSGWSCAGCGRLFSMRRKLIDRNGQLHVVGDTAQDTQMDERIKDDDR
ncbi:DUF746 domain-containing protein [Paraburkholderia acidicola]|uniref:DUF746 domain-containing protein n=1 Tax=Paraburkholderia acidicola TaxID=1912599 RepID=UPI001055B6CE|nr:DUF746 domain-containing protein [Paraburkholderia acidicola]